MHFNYGGNDDVIIKDDKRIPIIHVGCTTLVTSTSTFELDNILCAPSFKEICFLYLNLALKIIDLLNFFLIVLL